MYIHAPSRFHDPWLTLYAKKLGPAPRDEEPKQPERVSETTIDDRVLEGNPVEDIAEIESLPAYNERLYTFSHPPITLVRQMIHRYNMRQSPEPGKYVDIKH
jgi:hypothetical protein